MTSSWYVPSNLCGLSTLVDGFALISTLVLSKPRPTAEGFVYVAPSSFPPLILFKSICISAGVNCSSYYSGPIPRAAFILSWSFFMASLRFCSSYSPSRWLRLRYQSFLRHLPPLSKTPIFAEFPRYISRSLYGISLTFYQSKRDQPPRLPPLMGTQILRFSFYSRLVMTIYGRLL